ncbi:nicotinamide-nucleotide amidase [Microbacterium sp. SORGH_AS428]|uniref:CinA family protein n=2 Tax=Microbacterium TaxID=33882 RepID=UPI00285F5528|nr:CinA family protein [Microbacterium sp. SORGH_AS_0428]MDR6198855.1 nicotinamide-nucleotide amidase [Microbacterium sp. SORGH_AS_0428]
MSAERFMDDSTLDEQTSIVGGRRTDAEHIVQRLGELGWTIGIAESLTGGEVCSQLVAVAGASKVVRGGIVAYATALKQSLLGVDPLVLELGGPVQAKVARQMAEGVREAVAVDGAGADVGVATTGIAGPTSSDGQPVGTVFVAVSTPLGTRVELLQLDGDREQIRQRTARRALRMVLEAL